MSIFDTDTFLSATTVEANATKFDPIPESDYNAVIADTEKAVTVRSFARKDGSGDMHLLEVQWIIDNPQLAEDLGRTELRSRQSIFLDIDANGKLETGSGKNIGLVRLRDALGQNEPGQPWSPSMLRGSIPCLIKVTHRMNGEDVYDEVKSVVAI